jgi:hypothetical protein
MRTHIVVLAAPVLLTSAFAGAHVQTPPAGTTEPVTISPEELQRDIHGKSLPFMFIEEPY